MTDFPKMMFRKGGPYKGGYSVGNASDEAQYDRMKAHGWHDSKGAALGLAVKEATEAKEAVADVTEGEREAMETEAKALGVSFNARTSDKVLAERIAAAR
jgi:hypothetical protein